ncbi:MAG TPA: SCO family protein [Jatrophihabitans sp.]
MLLLAACSSGKGATPNQTGLNDQPQQCSAYCGFGLTTPQPRPSFTLTDATGKPFSFGTVTAGHPTLLFFGYTHCPDVCPETMADVGTALAKVPVELQQKTYVVFVTTDPTRDTGSVLTQWLSNFHTADQFLNKATFVGLRGTEDEIHAAEAAVHVNLSEDGGQTHSAELLLFGSDDYARVTYNSSSNEDTAIAHDLPLVDKSS